jgi:hypothetical protein
LAASIDATTDGDDRRLRGAEQDQGPGSAHDRRRARVWLHLHVEVDGDARRVEDAPHPLRHAGLRDAGVRDDEGASAPGPAHDAGQLRDPATAEQDAIRERDVERAVREAHAAPPPSRSLIPAASSTIRTTVSSPARSP